MSDRIEEFIMNRSIRLIQSNTINFLRIKHMKDYGILLAKEIRDSQIKYTEPGSLTYLLFGKQVSKQSINIKLGHLGEKLFKRLIHENKNIELLDCGLHCMIDGKKKDLDLFWADHNNKIIYYREAKGNIEMDTEKIPAMISKINKVVMPYVSEKYPGYQINIGVLAWSVYDRKILKKGTSQIKKIENNNINVDHFGDMLKLMNLTWKEEEFYKYFIELGLIINND